MGTGSNSVDSGLGVFTILAHDFIINNKMIFNLMNNLNYYKDINIYI